MKCKTRGCDTKLIKIKDKGDYCFACDYKNSLNELKQSTVEEKYKKGYRVTKWEQRRKDLLHCLDTLGDVKTEIKKKLNAEGRKVYALYRYE